MKNIKNIKASHKTRTDVLDFECESLYRSTDLTNTDLTNTDLLYFFVAVIVVSFQQYLKYRRVRLSLSKFDNEKCHLTVNFVLYKSSTRAIFARKNLKTSEPP